MGKVFSTLNQRAMEQLLYVLILLALGVGLIFDQPIQRTLEFLVRPVDDGVDPCGEMSDVSSTLLTGNV